MSNYTLTADQIGLYELSLAANTVMTIAHAQDRGLTVLVHSGSSPVYVKEGATVAVQDPTSTMIPVSTWSTIPDGYVGQLAIVSASAATISVYDS